MKTEAFDNELKQQLETRRISPSEPVWERLENQLGTEEKKPRKSRWWLKIAAVFLIGFLIGGLVFKSGEKPSDDPQLVEETVERPTEKPFEKTPLPEKVPSEKIPGTAIVETDEKASPKQPAPVFSPATNASSTKMENKENPIINSEIALGTPLALEEEADEIFQKLMTKTDPSAITDAEIEHLLQEARSEIAQQKRFEPPENSVVSAQALLESVERELQASYREKLFQLVEDKLTQLASANNPFR